MRIITIFVAISAIISSCASYRDYIQPGIAARNAEEIHVTQAFMNPPEYQKVVDTGRLAPVEFDRAMLWMNTRFVSARNVLQYSNRDAGMITGKASEPIDAGGEVVKMWYTITIETKDGKARLSIQNVHPVASDGMDLNYTTRMHEHFDLLANILIKDFSGFMQTETAAW